jgi:hypothetical protein
MLPNVSTFVMALERESQIFIVGDDVVRSWRVGSCYIGVVGTWISLQVPETVEIN